MVRGCNMGAVIETKSLSKQFNGLRAVDSLSLRVGRGEIYGFLGLNGAGKTTTIRLLLGMLHPNAGWAAVLGQRVAPGSHRLWSQVGYMVESPRSYPELTVAQNLEIVRRLRGLADPRTVTSIMEQLGLMSYRHQLAANLSLGNAQRLGLAKAIIHRPKVLLLDEPTNGLDPAGTVQVRQLLHHLADHYGVTIFLSSHLLAEVAQLATRIGIIHHGRLIEEADSYRLRQRLKKRLVLQTRHNRRARYALLAAGYRLAPAQGRPASARALALIDEQAVNRPEDVARLLVNAGVPPILLQVEEESLEAYFLRVIAQAEGANNAVADPPSS